MVYFRTDLKTSYLGFSIILKCQFENPLKQRAQDEEKVKELEERIAKTQKVCFKVKSTSLPSIYSFESAKICYRVLEDMKKCR